MPQYFVHVILNSLQKKPSKIQEQCKGLQKNLNICTNISKAQRYMYKKK